MTELLGIIKGNKIVWETHLQGTCIIRVTTRDVARLLSCLMFHPQHHIKPDMVAPTCNLSTQERKEDQEFKVILSYIVHLKLTKAA